MFPSRRFTWILILAGLSYSAVGCSSKRILRPTPGAHSAPSVRVGETVEISLRPEGGYSPGQGRTVRTTVSGFAPQDNRLIVDNGGGPVALDLLKLDTLRVYRRTVRPNTSAIWRAWLMGGATMAAVGAVSLFFSDSCTGFICFSDRAMVAGLGVLSGGSMIVLGTVGGLLGSEEIWEEVSLPVQPSGLAVTPEGKVGVSFQWKGRR